MGITSSMRRLEKKKEKEKVIRRIGESRQKEILG